MTVRPTRRSLFFSFFLLLVLLLPVGGAQAQTYAFTVDQERVDLYWETDGSLSIDYEITFTNAAYADPIDFVDIGLPNGNYRLSNIQASVDGHPIADIQESPYVTYGPALGLGSNAIPAGRSGTVRMRVTGIMGVLYTDNQDDGYASAVFSPNYFGSEFVLGNTDLSVVYHLPPGVDPAEPRWHPAPAGFPEQPETGFDAQGRITYTWRNRTASADTFYLFGASFPKTYIPAGTISEPSFSQRTGIDMEAVIGFLVFACFCLFIVGIIWIAVVAERRRKLRYLPPKMAIEGNGIKRGLTAPEAGILLEQPMDKILTMILFSVIKKEAASVVKRDPLQLEIAEPFPLQLREYEELFLQAFAASGKRAQRKGLQDLMVKLVKSVATKMKGFSKRETVAYYKKITEDAWAQVAAADTPEVKSERFQEELEWTMLDKDYDRRTQDVFRGPVFVPSWWQRYDPGYGRAAVGGGGGAKPSASVPNVATGSGSLSLPTLPGADFAASVTGGVQNLSAGVLGSLSDFTGGVTKVTNPPPKPSSSSRGGGWSGGGSSCACACAGCACACAGGGR
ncbi:MAG: hypothetical protein DWG76_05490 [Chloroflexi bacterium]|nr:hypothetical protein [Chloroflexota bacterium]MQC26884.1 hypothetical protein [Chloroflexota bacterium]